MGLVFGFSCVFFTVINSLPQTVSKNLDSKYHHQKRQDKNRDRETKTETKTERQNRDREINNGKDTNKTKGCADKQTIFKPLSDLEKLVGKFRFWQTR